MNSAGQVTVGRKNWGDFGNFFYIKEELNNSGTRWFQKTPNSISDICTISNPTNSNALKNAIHDVQVNKMQMLLMLTSWIALQGGIKGSNVLKIVSVSVKKRLSGLDFMKSGWGTGRSVGRCWKVLVMIVECSKERRLMLTVAVQVAVEYLIKNWLPLTLCWEDGVTQLWSFYVLQNISNFLLSSFIVFVWLQAFCLQKIF